jgi:nitroimidazol reductase NimA-like FMN-containing flavoprotein (pyridoxamine 5'-phosphate oxidase superfamily)
VEAVLRQARVCRLGLVDGDEAYIVPLSFGYHGGELYFHSARSGRKISLLRMARRVCFEVDIDVGPQRAAQACDWGTRYRSIIGWGRVRFVERFDDKVQALDRLMAHFGETRPAYDPAVVERTAVFVLTIDEMRAKANT